MIQEGVGGSGQVKRRKAENMKRIQSHKNFLLQSLKSLSPAGTLTLGQFNLSQEARETAERLRHMLDPWHHLVAQALRSEPWRTPVRPAKPPKPALVILRPHRYNYLSITQCLPGLLSTSWETHRHKK